jgi:hypothetical protein
MRLSLYHRGFMQQDFHDELAAAIAAERAAWQMVKDKLPGSPGHVKARWLAWQAAVQRCRVARQTLDAASGRTHDAAGAPGDAAE